MRGSPRAHALGPDRSQLGGEGGFIVQIAPGHAVHLDAEGAQVTVSAAVLVVGPRGVVKGLSVELDAEAGVLPVGVELVAADEEVGAGLGEAVVGAQA